MEITNIHNLLSGVKKAFTQTKTFVKNALSNTKRFLQDKNHSHIEELSPFIDLAPVNGADSDGIYTKALSFSLKKPHIKNVAITGPYGSGKSSIIKTFESSRKDLKFLNISLASFNELVDTNVDGKVEHTVSTPMIEKSILQQMIYSTSADQLLYSRFKRIRKPKNTLRDSLLLVLWSVGIFFLFQKKEDFITYLAQLFDPQSLIFSVWESNLWIQLVAYLIISFFFALPVVCISDIIKTSFGLTLKRISIKNAEIETEKPSNTSILNRHIDEIIYFFHETKYRVVVFEDLERFEKPEIFVKLREINKLINDSGHQVTFVYAINDVMFVNKTRVKFFDFIIPVIPIINTSNSLDKIQERLGTLGIDKNIDPQFIREVSLFLGDLRLINNIFNEFAIYRDKLKSEKINLTNLLAIIIYKNVYPKDFEHLHDKKGMIFSICNKRSEYLEVFKDKLQQELQGKHEVIKTFEEETAKNIMELIQIYVSYLVTSATDSSVIGIMMKGQQVPFNTISTFEQFQAILSSESVQLYNGSNVLVETNKSFSQIEEEINPGETFLGRKKNIELKLESQQKQIEGDIKQIEEGIEKLPQMKLSQVLQESDIDLEKLAQEYKIIDSSLLIYLVKNGFIDDSYNFYISRFHKGRLTENDRDYLLTIRNFKQPTPSQKIDTPKEVCENMRKEDFENYYVLNVDLIDYLIKTSEKSQEHAIAAINYIAEHYNEIGEFLSAYFVSGKYLKEFIRLLSNKWSVFSAAAINSSHAAELISYILRFIESDYLVNSMNDENILTNYLSEKGFLVFASDFKLPKNYDSLKKLNVHFQDLTQLEKNQKLIDFAHTEDLYTLTAKNVNYIFHKYADPINSKSFDSEKENYTAITNSGSKELQTYINNNLPEYIEKVFLVLPDNTNEHETEIKSLLNNSSLNDSLRAQIISKQTLIFPELEELPKVLWNQLLEKEKITISWRNLAKYLSIEGHSKEIVTELLKESHITNPLSKRNIGKENLTDAEKKLLSRFILNNDEITDNDYSRLIKRIPYRYNDFPENVSEEKLKYLVQEGRVDFNEKSFTHINGNIQILAAFLSKNIDAYIKNKEKYLIDDGVRELLLTSQISSKDKTNICYDVTQVGATNSKQLSSLIANILLDNNVDPLTLDEEVLSTVIINTLDVTKSVKLLNKCLDTWSKEKIIGIISKLPSSYNEIASYGKRPKLLNSEENLEFTKLLKDKGFVSSIKITPQTIQINTHSKQRV